MSPQSVPDALRDIFFENLPLAQYATWGVGGVASALFRPRNTSELAGTLQYLSATGAKFFTLGGGSNVLIYDGLIDTPCIHTVALDRLEVSPGDKEVFIKCGAGASLRDVFARSLQEGWSGLEFASGIPGTVGGAVIGNAGTREGSISAVVASVQTVNRNGMIVHLQANDLKWAYRASPINSDDEAVVSEISLRLLRSECRSVRARARAAAARRRTQPLAARTAGCVFKNPPGDTAGRLLEAAGCKGLACNDARVSQQHANFIENIGQCKADDILKLVALCRKSVHERFGVDLQCEIKMLGFPNP